MKSLKDAPGQQSETIMASRHGERRTFWGRNASKPCENRRKSSKNVEKRGKNRRKCSVFGAREALPTRDSSSNSGHTTPRMKGSAWASCGL